MKTTMTKTEAKECRNELRRLVANEVLEVWRRDAEQDERLSDLGTKWTAREWITRAPRIATKSLVTYLDGLEPSKAADSGLTGLALTAVFCYSEAELALMRAELESAVAAAVAKRLPKTKG